MKRIGNLIVNVLFWGCLLWIGFLVLKIFCISTFRIPSESMQPVLESGDYIVANKLIPGPRLYNIFKLENGRPPSIKRLTGYRKVRRNDVVVFNFPHPDNWEKIEMHVMKYYVKRCIGLPGDTVSIRNGYYRTGDTAESPGNRESQARIAARRKESFEPVVYTTYPYQDSMGWNIKEFGPLYVPRQGDRIVLDETCYHLYKQLIEWEEKGTLEYRDQQFFLNGTPVTSYCFRHDYYFMGGDNGEDSQDSRYWGLLPDEFIAGKAWFIWKSVDPFTRKIRWERILKKIN
ncbi:MAG: signal peptidase I [Tannerellaceae bacterium]|nr:signal peptidase I [Tannerellaceae bacterium]